MARAIGGKSDSTDHRRGPVRCVLGCADWIDAAVPEGCSPRWQRAERRIPAACGLTGLSVALGISLAPRQAVAQPVCVTSPATTETAVGTNAFACGPNTNATGNAATAIGAHSTANGANATVTGAFSTANGIDATVMGASSTANGIGGTATGEFSTANGGNAAATGAGSTANGGNATATGDSAPR